MTRKNRVQALLLNSGRGEARGARIQDPEPRKSNDDVTFVAES